MPLALISLLNLQRQGVFLTGGSANKASFGLEANEIASARSRVTHYIVDGTTSRVPVPLVNENDRPFAYTFDLAAEVSQASETSCGFLGVIAAVVVIVAVVVPNTCERFDVGDVSCYEGQNAQKRK